MKTANTIKIEVKPSSRNFHNARPVNICVERCCIVGPEEDVPWLEPVVRVVLSKAQQRRLARHFCGISSCHCGSGPSGLHSCDYPFYPALIEVPFTEEIAAFLGKEML